jgi:membrane fusion protein, multidrug efflux system
MRSILLFSSLLLLAACREEPKRAGAPPRAPVVVQVAAATLEERPSVYEATGTVRARTTATLSSRVMGYVLQVQAQVGDRVREGQPLVTLDARDMETGVRRADAGRAEIESAIPEAESGMAAAQAQLELAQATFRRVDELARKKSVSSQEFDEASARLKAAQASYEMARAKRRQLDAKMAQVEQERRSAAIIRDYAQLNAPFAGVVTARSVEPGNLAAPGAPLLTIERADAYRLEVAVEESKLSAVRAGQRVEVALEALDRTIPARVSEVVPAVDASSRAYIVKIDLPPLAQVRSGMFGRALFPLGKRQVLAVPASAVVEHGQLQAVYVVEDGAAHTRLVTLGAKGEVLSGLTAGERVVAPVPVNLGDGAKVEVRQ